MYGQPLSKAYCRAEHRRCHVAGSSIAYERGCGCCPCVRTVARNPDCYGCTRRGCACYIPWATEPAGHLAGAVL
jgi:hypothetical protein